jgi:hypothetical protein
MRQSNALLCLKKIKIDFDPPTAGYHAVLGNGLVKNILFNL